MSHIQDEKEIGTTEHLDQSVLQPELDLEGNHKLHRHGAAGREDEAARLMAEQGQVNYTAEERKRVLRKIDIAVCIPLCLTYFIQQMDKSSLSWAAVFDIQKLTGLHGTQFSWLTSCVYIAQLIAQPLSSYALIVFPVKYWVMFNMISWGIVTLCTSAAKNFTALLICRIFLGAFEATILPSFVFIVQMWYTRREQTFRNISYQVANSCAAIIGPLISYGIGHVGQINHGAIEAYQGIFMFMGAFTLFIAPIVWYLLPNSPTTAKFLRHGNDRLIAIERLRENNTGTKVNKFNWAQFRETMTDLKTYVWALLFFCCSCPSGGIGTFGGLITKGFGFSSFTSILMQIPTGCIGIICILGNVYIQDRFRLRFPFIALMTIPAIAGAAALTFVPRNKPGALIGAYYICYCYSSLQPLLYAWANVNAAGTTKRVVTTAVLFVAQCVGNIVGPQVYLTREAPVYKTGLTVDMVCWATLFCAACFMGFWLNRLNKKQRERRIAMGLPGDIKDMSIMTLDEAQAYRQELTEMLRAAGFDERRLYENAFDDLTDFENPTFQYVM